MISLLVKSQFRVYFILYFFLHIYLILIVSSYYHVRPTILYSHYENSRSDYELACDVYYIFMNVLPSAYCLNILLDHLHTCAVSSKSGQDIMNHGFSVLHICFVLKHIFGPYHILSLWIDATLVLNCHLLISQVKEMMNLQREVKRKCLRRTQTGPW